MTITSVAVPLCKCGHDREAHEHFRAGSDCGSCVATSCSKFRRAWFAHRPASLLIDGPARRTPARAGSDVTRPEAA